MKKFLSFLVISFVMTSNAYSLNFNQKLSDYLENNKGVTSIIYILNRCTGILTYNSIMMFKENAEVGLYYNFMSSELMNLASKYYANHNNVSFDMALEVNSKRMMQLEEYYRQDADEMFLKNGMYLTGIVNSDLMFCENLNEDLKNKGII
tara:strand:+ start:2658 stop:3107 length:450 start_codon:yes stop_codon:yes gene_type:complete